MSEFKYEIRQNRFDDSIRTVKCYLYCKITGVTKQMVEKTFYGNLPFQFFWIERWIKKTEKMLRRLEDI